MKSDDADFALPHGAVLQGSQRYVIERLLGAGGFGKTYLASTVIAVGAIRAKAYVAIKEHFVSDLNEREAGTLRVTTPGTARSRQTVENSLRDFLGEARRLQQLGEGHPDIVKVNEVFEANGTAYYVMEYLDGNSLWSAIAGKPMDEDAMLRLMFPIVDAVAYLHRNRLTHLDIKPQNIMLAVGDDGEVTPVLIDFGLSKHYDADGNATSTVNTLACSDGYSPIEQYSGITTFTPAADVYALGATMLACLTGTTPAKSTAWPAGQRMRYLDSLPLSEPMRTALRGALADIDTRLPDANALLGALGSSTTAHFPQGRGGRDLNATRPLGGEGSLQAKRTPVINLPTPGKEPATPRKVSASLHMESDNDIRPMERQYSNAGNSTDSLDGAHQKTTASLNSDLNNREALPSGNKFITFLRSIVSLQKGAWVDIAIGCVLFPLINWYGTFSSIISPTLAGCVVGGIVYYNLCCRSICHATGCSLKTVAMKYSIVRVGSLFINTVGTYILFEVATGLWVEAGMYLWIKYGVGTEYLGAMPLSLIYMLVRLPVGLLVSWLWNAPLQRHFVFRQNA
ncbi:MAG: serine/threonine protein kinase [Muribaculaceae bacterium]|nr:serine/threonine protein kinase [Muribaculaceae bacterium]